MVKSRLNCMLHGSNRSPSCRRKKSSVFSWESWGQSRKLMSDSKLSPLKQAFLRIEELEAQLKQSARLQHEPIAVVGIGCRLPGAVAGPDAYWEILRTGTDATRDVPLD